MGRLLLLRVLALLAALGAAAAAAAEEADDDLCCGWIASAEWPLELFPCPALDVGPNVTFCCRLCYPRASCPFGEDDGEAWPEQEQEQEQCPGDARPPATSASALLEHFWSSPFFLLGILGAAAVFVLCMLRCHTEDACLRGSDSDSVPDSTPADSGTNVYSRLRDDDPPPSYAACAVVTPQCSVTGVSHLQNLPGPSTENPAGFRQAVSGIPRKDNVVGLPPLSAPEGTAASDGAPEPTLPTESCSSLAAQSDAETGLC